jgi:hypothetical protein
VRRAALLAGLLLVATGCSRCGSAVTTGAPASSPVERVLPKGAAAVVVVPSVARLGQKVALLERLKVASFLAPTQGFADAKAFADALVGELGIDLRSPAALEQAGLDGERPMGVAVLVTTQVYVALPVRDAEKFHAALGALAGRRLGATVGAERLVDGVGLKTFATAAGVERVAYVLAHGFALVAADDAIGALPAMSKLGEGDSLATDARLPVQLARVPAARDAWAWLPTGTPALARFPFTSLLASASLEPTGLTVTFDAPVKPGAEASVALLKPLTAPDVAGFLPRDAFLVARFNGEPAQLAPLATELFGPALSGAFAEGGFDLKSDGLGLVKPGVVVALSLAERPPLGQGLPDLDPRRTNPFTFAHLSGVAVAKESQAAVLALDKVVTLAPRFGAQLKKAERDGVTAYLTTWSQGEGVHFAIKGEQVFFGSPLPRVQALAKADGALGSPVAGLTDDAVSVVVDLRRLAGSVRALPESSWGLGGFALKGTTVRWLDATDDLVAVAASASARDGVVQGRVVLSLAMGGKAP